MQGQIGSESWSDRSTGSRTLSGFFAARRASAGPPIVRLLDHDLNCPHRGSPSFHRPAAVPGPCLASRLSARVVVAGCPRRSRGVGGHGTGRHGLCKDRRRAANHGALHDRAAAGCLRAARHLAPAGRRPGHCDRPDLLADGRHNRGAGNCGLQFAHLHSQPRSR